MGDADELSTLARVVSRLIPIAAALAAVAFLLFSVAGYERITSHQDSAAGAMTIARRQQ